MCGEPKFVERFNQLRKINKFTDCSFKVEDRVFGCHKLILCAASPVFEAMMYSKFSEGSDYLLDVSNSIKITDISYETFESFLNYIYTGELAVENDGNEMDRLLELSYCAQKYIIEDMRKQCIQKLTEQLNDETILSFIAKSFEKHLEDILVSCLYYIADSLETGKHFSNLILNNENLHLTSRCFEFLLKNLLDYFGERDDVLCLVKAWSFTQLRVENMKISDETEAVVLRSLNLDENLREKIVQMKFSIADSSVKSFRIPRSFHRVYYKPVRPLIIEPSQLSFNANLSFKRFVIVNSLMVNSRLIPEQYDICDMSSQTYVENIHVEIFDKNSNESIYKQLHTISNVSYNAFFRINFTDSMILLPHHIYTIKLTWSIEAISFEYPRCIFSLLEKGSDGKVDANKNPLSGLVQFHEYDYCYNSPFGSIIQGISYDLIS